MHPNALFGRQKRLTLNSGYWRYEGHSRNCGIVLFTSMEEKQGTEAVLILKRSRENYLWKPIGLSLDSE